MCIFESSRLCAEGDFAKAGTFTHDVVMIDRDFQCATDKLLSRDTEQQSFVKNRVNITDFLQTRFPLTNFLIIVKESCFCV